MGKSYSDDPFNNVIQEGIKEDIRFNLEQERFRAAMILIYSGIDAMSFLSLPQGKKRASGQEFRQWCDRYLLNGAFSSVKSEEVWGARCAMVHSYGVASDATEKRGARFIAFCTDGSVAVRADDSSSSKLVLLSLGHFAQSFFDGVDKCMIDLHQDASMRDVVDKRLNWMFAQSSTEDVLNRCSDS